MLVARDLVRHHGAQVVLQSVSVSVTPGTRLGVVGPNGIGKSTLLRILAGLEQPDDGVVERSPATTTVGWLPQEPDANAGERLGHYLARRTGVAEASAALDRAAAALSGEAHAIQAHADALDVFLALGGDDLEGRTGAVLAQVGLPADRVTVAVGHLSGGQAARAALAAILLSRHDVLLLDEPTNDLDFAGLDLLEAFVATTPSAVVTVSHDRAFLDRVATRILELREPGHDAVEHAGGWTAFVASRELARRQQAEGYDKFTAQRDRLQQRQQTQREWAVQGVRNAKRKKTDNDKFIPHLKSQRSEKMASKVKATEKAIERLDVVEKPWEPWQLQLELKAAGRSGDVVGRLDGAVVELGAFRLGPVDLAVAWQDRLAILGPNGSGKTTLLRAFLGEVPLAGGSRWVGPGVTVGLLDQRRARYEPGEPLLPSFMAVTGFERSEARSLLAKFGLGADHVDRPWHRMSPGERTRAQLAELMATGVNCLVLDEPTNHLDLEAIEQLEAALEGFDGTVLLVTHDRAFLEAVHVTRTLDLADVATSAR
ncbi:MAG: ABC-F family ATP-binding cassette domain-containing protein [Acidimicrobiales bacterium]|nr:ABC-F family ATP-binding cassette domain-containing protein [Acidimicrobiales bacterium]